MVEVQKLSSSSPLSVSQHTNLPRTESDNNNQIAETTPPTKKKRNLPGMPDPDAEVIALSPKTLLATNRFVCEICSKGFQRDQNLQLHRRGHNLPWKLRQRTTKEVRRRVYVCPEANCIHHDPLRALGDLTGIKKHFCRKHGEKKFNCDRCSKKYAVQSDWKAHMKTCGSKEYRCDCGTLFSRRDSFITHRAFCDALAKETAHSTPQPMVITSSDVDLKVITSSDVDLKVQVAGSPPPPPLTPSTSVLSPVLSVQSSEMPENQTAHLTPLSAASAIVVPSSVITTTTVASATTTTAASATTGTPTANIRVFASIFSAPISSELPQTSQQPSPSSQSYSTPVCTMAGLDRSTIDPISLSLSSSFYGTSSLFPTTSHYTSTSQPSISATALLQKAAQIGASTSNSSYLHGLGSGLGLGLPCGGSSGYNELMLSPSTLYGNARPATFDFLGLGMGGGEASNSGGFSVFLNSINRGGMEMGSGGSFGDKWNDDDASDTKPSSIL